MVGRTVLQYQFIEKLGSGGMGEIFKAQDTKLNRFVAIKILPVDKAGDADRRLRFVQEAQAASALNHPNIITIHDIVSDGDIQYMVMEFVPGQTLLDLIPVGGMRVQQVLQYSTQMADALATAHAAGIIHRDFKPANVMITSSGLVKVLDFGLAKLTDRNPNSQFDSETTAADRPITVEGSIMGTVSYMSPEQAEGKRVDARSDIFSFGSVLYEMVTGRRAFHGDSGISTLTSVLRDDIKPMSELALDVPPLLEVIIGRCLNKDPAGRWQSMQEVGGALTALRRTLDSGAYDKPAVPATTVAATAPVPPPLPVAPAAPAGPLTAPPPVVPPAPAVKRGGAKDLAFGLVCILIVVGMAVGGWWWVTHRQAPPQRVAQVPAPSTPAPVTPVPVTPAPATDTGTPAPTIPAPTTPAPAPAKSAGSKPAGSKPAASTTAPPGSKPAASTTAPPGPTSPTTSTPPETKPTPRKAVIKTVPVTVSASLPFRITLDDDVAADASAGQALRFTVADGLTVGDAVVIAKGATVTGEIVGESGKKFLGIGKKMTFRLIQADAVDGHKLSVRVMPGSSAKGPPSRAFDTGKGSKSKELAAAKGTEYIAYTDGEQTVAVRK